MCYVDPAWSILSVFKILLIKSIKLIKLIKFSIKSPVISIIRTVTTGESVKDGKVFVT